MVNVEPRWKQGSGKKTKTVRLPDLSTRSRGLCEARTEACITEAVHKHHIQPRRHGDHSAENLLHVCAPCHGHIHSHPEESYRMGWLKKGNT